MRKLRSSKYLVHAAVIGAIYTALTVLLMPLSYGVMQIRIAEALTIMPALTPAAIPGLFIGCLVSNMIGPYGLIDMIFGSIATLISGLISYRLRAYPVLVPLPPVIVNGLIIGPMLYYVYSVPVSLAAAMAWVALGEAIACYVIGYPLLRYLNKRKSLFRF